MITTKNNNMLWIIGFLAGLIIFSLFATNVLTKIPIKEISRTNETTVADTDNSSGIPTDENTIRKDTFEVLFDTALASGPFDFNTLLASGSSAKELDRVCDSIIAEIITPGMSVKEQIKQLHDYICVNIAYDTTYEQHDAMDTLDPAGERLAVCSGYSAAFTALCRKLNIPCEIIMNNDKSHAWNKVTMDDGKDYYIDLTWDDPLVNGISSDYKDGRNVRYDYFLVPYSEISKDHDFTDPSTTSGTSTEYREWANNIHQVERTEKFHTLLGNKGYPHVIETAANSNDIRQALTELVNSGHSLDGCVIAYYKDTENPTYTLYTDYIDGKYLQAEIQEWGFDYYYIVLSFEGSGVAAEVDNDSSDINEDNTSENSENADNNVNKDDSDKTSNDDINNTSQSNDSFESDNSDKTSENNTQNNTDNGNSGNNTNQTEDNKHEETNSGNDNSGIDNSDNSSQNNGNNESNNGTENEVEQDQWACNPDQDPYNMGNAPIGGGSNVENGYDDFQPSLERYEPQEIDSSASTLWQSADGTIFDITTEIVNGTVDEPF